MNAFDSWLWLCTGLLFSSVAYAGNYAGTYAADGMTMRIQSASRNVYDGTLDSAAGICVFHAEYRSEVGGLPPGYDAPIVGTMRCGERNLRFLANLHDASRMLELRVETTTYLLRREPTAATPQTPSSSAQRPREAFVLEQVLAADGGNAYAGRMHGNSARAGLQWVTRQIAGGFDADVVGDEALADSGDARAQLLFHTTGTRIPIRGLILSQRIDDAVQVALVYQNVGKAAEDMGAALAAALQRFPGDESESLRRAVFPDGSGSLMLPPGWRIVDAYAGAVNAAGSNGAQVDLGAHRIVLDPRLIPGQTPGLMVGVYCHPAESLWILFPALNAINAQMGDTTRIRLERVIEYQDTQSPSSDIGGQWAFVYYEWTTNGTPYLSVALIGTVQLSVNWAHYWSAVSAPKAIFKQELPRLVRIWQSYSVSAQSVTKRLDDALRNMREAGEIYRQGLEAASKGSDVVAETWRQVIRDQTVIEGPDGWRYDTKLSGLDRFLLEHRDFKRVPVEALVAGH